MCSRKELVGRVQTHVENYSADTCPRGDEKESLCLQRVLRELQAAECAEIAHSKLFQLLLIFWMLFTLVGSVLWPLVSKTPQKEPIMAWVVIRLFMAGSVFATAVLMPELFHSLDPFHGIWDWTKFISDMVAYLNRNVNRVVVAELKADYVSQLLSMPYRGISAGVTVLYTTVFFRFGKDRTVELTKYCFDALCVQETLFYTFCLVSPVLVFQLSSTLDTLQEVTGVINDFFATWAFGSTYVSFDDLLATYSQLPATGLLPLVVLLCTLSDVIVFSWPWSLSWMPTCACMLAGLFFAETIRAVIGMSLRWALLATGLLLMVTGLAGVRFVKMLHGKLASVGAIKSIFAVLIPGGEVAEKEL